MLQEPLLDTPTHAIYRHDNLVLEVMREVADEESMLELRETIIRESKHWAPQLGMMVVIPPHIGVPGAGARKGMRELHLHLGEIVGAAALVIEGTGLRAATIRGLATGAAMAMRSPILTRSFADPLSGARWLQSEVGMAIDLPRLASSIFESRSPAG